MYITVVSLFLLTVLRYSNIRISSNNFLVVLWNLKQGNSVEVHIHVSIWNVITLCNRLFDIGCASNAGPAWAVGGGRPTHFLPWAEAEVIDFLIHPIRIRLMQELGTGQSFFWRDQWADQKDLTKCMKYDHSTNYGPMENRDNGE